MQYIRFAALTSSKMEFSDHEKNGWGRMRPRMATIACRLQKIAVYQRRGDSE